MRTTPAAGALSVRHVTSASPPAASGVRCPDGLRAGVPGQRIKSPAGAVIYLIDPEGCRRALPDEATYEYFFRDWSGIITSAETACIYLGSPLDAYEDYLARSHGGAYYVVEGALGDRAVARRIPSIAVNDKYHFRRDSAYAMDQAWLDSHAGPDWT